MKRKLLIGIVIIAALVLIGGLFQTQDYTEVSSFEECVEAGNPVMESYPRQCRSAGGVLFVEDVDIKVDTHDLIRIDQPRPSSVVSSPLSIAGEARGNWFFEASFPIALLDANGSIVAEYFAEAQDEWMTTEFVPFISTVTFSRPTTLQGELVLKKSNPSGLPEYDDEIRIPIAFSQSATYAPPAPGACVVTGCSRQVCADEDVVTTCEFREEYACYESAVCERQETGECGWTETEAFTECFDNATMSS